MNEHRKAPSHSVPALFVFLLLGLFALFSLVLIMFGAQAYHNTVERTEAHNTERVLSSFIRNNLRTADQTGSIHYVEDGSLSRLVITDPEDSEYETLIYVYDGSLCQLYTETGKNFNPEAGEEICDAESLSANIADGTITVSVTANGTEHITVFAPRCEEEPT